MSAVTVKFICYAGNLKMFLFKESLKYLQGF